MTTAKGTAQSTDGGHRECPVRGQTGAVPILQLSAQRASASSDLDRNRQISLRPEERHMIVWHEWHPLQD